jgi:hypothetical protein
LEQQAPPGPTGVTAIPGSELMRSPWNKRGYSASEHKAGAKVYVHGYSLEMRRKLRLLNANGNEVERQANGNDIVWGRGGLRAFEPLNAFNFPTGVAGIGHLDIDPSMLGGAANAQYLVPIFDVMETVNEGVMLPGELSPVLPGVAPERNAADYFQSRGVCVLQGRAYLYRKEPLPPAYAQVQAMFRQALPRPQTIGLKILGSYAGGRSQPGLQGWEEWRREAHGNWPWPVFLFDLTQRSLMTSGVIGNLYPPTGILEVRGSPTPWEAYRPNFMGQPMLGRHPDDCVEWIRYAEIFDGVMGGEPLHLFVGRTGSNFNFRGYPEREIQGRPDLRKQLDHPANEPLRLVMELAEGGAGYGDYVTIATSNPAVYERVPRRIFKVLEHEDGRFFASLLDVSSTGVDIPTSPSVFQNTYTRVMNPRLVKFPTWGLSEVYAGSAVLFGDARSGGAASGRQNVGGVREDEDEDPTGITVDEVRRFQNKTMFHNPTLGPRVRFVVVPLDGGAVKQVSTPDGGIALSGEILAGRDISRASPLEVLVVSVSKEETPSIFARGPLKVETEGVLRIGDELFYFEDPYATGDGASPPPGVGTLAGDVNAVAGDDSRVRDPRDRNRLWPENIPGGGLSGHWEREGFARLYDRVAVRFGWSEVFYYKSMGGGFSGCLRGQFGTPISQRVVAATFHNVSRRLRLVGRGLLGTERRTHGYGAPAAHVPYLAMSPITGPLTDEGLAVKSPRFFGKPHGYALLDAAQPNAPWEIIAHLGPAGERLLAVPRDEKGKAMFRACYGTQLRPISNQMFAYELPFRHPDRYEPEREGEGLAYLQKSYRMPGAYWRALEWLERPSRTLRERKPDIVIAARFDGAPEWDAKPTNEPGGLYLFEKADGDEGEPKRFELDRIADQLEIRVYFRYPSGAFTRLPLNRLTDDWKETGILEWLNIEYEKAGVITRHEDLPF